MFQTLPPPPELQPFVRFFWTVRAPAGTSLAERAVPDGCCELIWQLADSFERFDGTGEVTRQPQAFLFGQIERAIVLAPLGVIDILGVRLTPAGVAGLWEIDASTLQAREYPLDDLFPATNLPSLEQLRDTLSFEARCAIVSQWLEGGLRRTQRPRMRRTVAALSMMQAGILRSDEIADRVGCTRRSLERAFRSTTGLAPAAYLRLLRVGACVQQLRASAARLSVIAADAGYADQAHFSREFRRIVGISPSDYRQEQGIRTPLMP